MFYFKKYYPKNCIIIIGSCHGFHGVFQADVVFFVLFLFLLHSFSAFHSHHSGNLGFSLLQFFAVDSEIEKIYI